MAAIRKALTAHKYQWHAGELWGWGRASGTAIDRVQSGTTAVATAKTVARIRGRLARGRGRDPRIQGGAPRTPIA